MALFSKRSIDINDFMRGAVVPSTGSMQSTGNLSEATAKSAIDLIAGTFANLSGHFFKASNKKRLDKHNIYWILNHPNMDEGRFIFFHQCVVDYFMASNIYWMPVWKNNELTAIFRLPPKDVTLKRNNSNVKVYRYNNKDYTGNSIIHIPSRWGYDGLKGKSIFDYASAVFDTAANLEKITNTIFDKSIGHRLVIDINEAWPNATLKQIDELQEQMNMRYMGPQNIGKPLVSSNKIKYSHIDISEKNNKATELVDNKKFQEGEIAKLFGIPLGLLTGTDRDIEPLFILFVENAVRPIATQFEQGDKQTVVR